MRLNEATEYTLNESRIAHVVCLNEEEEGPRWKFSYDKWRNDPSPDILLLGAYRHPNTRNNLVGGINLHYLNEKQRDSLARNLPKIMQGNNLRQRYWLGKQLDPDIFKNHYRTYDSKFIRGVQKDIMYPKYGMVKTAKKWLQKQIGNLRKTKQQRQQDLEPEYPQDLETMQNKLDQVVSQLQQDPPKDQPVDTPEMKAAMKAFKDFQRERTIAGLKDKEDRQLRHAKHDHEQEIGLRPGPEPEEPDVIDQLQAKQDFENSREDNLEELEDPDNRISLDPGELDLEESIVYYSPRKGYIVENISICDYV